jgi:predicted acylesterase/phospholipase RssA
MSSLPWLGALVFALVWYLALGRRTLARTLGRMSRHWFPMALFGAICLMAAGYIGADLGIQQLFRDDPAVGFNWNSPGFWGAFGATVLVGEIWIIVYLVEYIANYVRLDPASRPPGSDRRRWAELAQDLARFKNPRPMLEFLLASVPPFLVLFALCASFPVQAGGPVGDGRGVWIDLLVYTGGMLLGVVTLVALVLVGFWLTRLARFVLAWLGWINRRVLGTAAVTSRWLRIDDSAPTGDEPDPRTAVAVAFWVFLLVLLLVAVVPLTWGLIVPSLAISVLFGLVLAVYFVLVSLKRSAQLVFLVAVVAYTSWSNSGAYKYRLPGMTAGDGTSLYDSANLLPAERTEADGPGPADPLLDNESVLRRWKANQKEAKPKLVLVSVTGGAYRAGFWTAAVLDELEERSRPGGSLPGLTSHIRIMTGASGGTVGAAYFVSLRDHKGASLVGAMLADSRRDSLTPVIQQMVQRDVPMILCPVGYQPVDRGVRLEEQWRTLARPFHATYADERQGRCPSLILSPMVIETGERMLISNLDLEDLSTPVSTTGELYLGSARQFYRMFPSTQSTFGLNTAVRMSASFPYVSPAVSLPTKPVRRVVDAGYYDNYGVNLAAAWAYEYRDWIRRETSGIALIQIYAYPRTGAPEGEPGAPLQGGVATGLARDFSWVTSPIEGALGARNWSMLYRNEEQLRMLDDTFNGAEGPRMFETFVFANPGGAAMNWSIALQDVSEMQQSIAGRETNETEKSNKRQMDKLAAWWNGRHYQRRLERPISAPDRRQQTQFEQSDALTPNDEQRINLTIDRFRAYLKRLGFTPKTGWIKVRITEAPGDNMNAFYDTVENTIVIGSKIGQDRDPVLREYAHHMLAEASKSKDWGTLNGFESGFADYFPCSFKGEPEFGVKFVEVLRKNYPKLFTKPYVRTLDNRRRFDTLEKSQADTQPEPHDEGEVWGAAFWELRETMGRDEQGNRRADVLLLKTVQNLKFPRPGDGAREAVVALILEQDEQLYQGQHAAKIREVFEQRGLKPPPPAPPGPK